MNEIDKDKLMIVKGCREFQMCRCKSVFGRIVKLY